MIEINYLNNFILPDASQVIHWINNSITIMGKYSGNLVYIFCDDAYLLEINQKYLKHDTYTDIISFDYSEKDILSGDIFISTQRVLENTTHFNTSFSDELHRVMIHGILHFAGFKDKTKSQSLNMRQQEDYYLSLRDF